jgi:hypothetical protein
VYWFVFVCATTVRGLAFYDFIFLSVSNRLSRLDSSLGLHDVLLCCCLSLLTGVQWDSAASADLLQHSNHFVSRSLCHRFFFFLTLTLYICLCVCVSKSVIASVRLSFAVLLLSYLHREKPVDRLWTCTTASRARTRWCTATR